MRRILVENARRKTRLKHCGGRLRVDLDAVGFLANETSEDLEAPDEALDKLAEEDPAKAELVKLCFFACLTLPKVAKVMKVSLATAKRDWTYARTWPDAELKDQGIPQIKCSRCRWQLPSATGLTPAPGSLPSSRTGAIQKNLRIFSKGMRGFARVCRVEDSEVIALSLGIGQWGQIH